MKHILEMANFKKITSDKQDLIKKQYNKALKSNEFKDLLTSGLFLNSSKRQDANMTIALSSKYLKLTNYEFSYSSDDHNYKNLTYLITVNFYDPESPRKHGDDDFLYRPIWDVHITNGTKYTQFPNANAYRYSSLLSVFKDILKHHEMKKLELKEFNNKIVSLINKIKTNDDIKRIKDDIETLKIKYLSHNIEPEFKDDKDIEYAVINLFKNKQKLAYFIDNLSFLISKETADKIIKDAGFTGKEFELWG